MGGKRSTTFKRSEKIVMKQLLSYILEHLVQDYTKVDVHEEESDGYVQFRATVPKDQMGKVIGKGGKMIKAIRTLLKVKAAKENKGVNIELVEQ